MRFFVIVNTGTLAVCMTGFLYATLVPVTAAFKKRVSVLPFVGNSDQRSLLAEMRFFSGLRKGWRENITSPQHNTLSEGMLTRYFAGWLCPGFKPISDWVLLNCAPGLLRLNLTACAGDCMLGPYLGTQRAQAVQCLTLGQS